MNTFFMLHRTLAKGGELRERATISSRADTYPADALCWLPFLQLDGVQERIDTARMMMRSEYLMCKRAVSASILIALSCVAAAAEPPPASRGKQAWELTREERLALRFDPSLSAARRAVAVAEGVVKRDDSDPHLNVVIGSRDPEILMAWELMDDIIWVFNLEDPKRQKTIRATWAERGAAKHLGEDFWQRLQLVLGPIIDARAELRRAQAEADLATPEAQSAANEAWSRANRRICPLRAKGLRDARAKFGAEEFERFLYQVIAPDALVLKSSSTTSPSERASSEVWVEDGCQ